MNGNINIVVYAKGSCWLCRVAFSLCAQIGVIGIGSLINNPAMSWSGFVMLVVLVIALTLRDRDNKPLTIQQARKRLDDLEAAE